NDDDVGALAGRTDGNLGGRERHVDRSCNRLLRGGGNAADKEAVGVETFRGIEPFLLGNEVRPEERYWCDLANGDRCSSLRRGFMRRGGACYENAECEDCRLFQTKH